MIPLLAEMNPLQLQVVRLGICPFCHKKTLVDVEFCREAGWRQCCSCNRVFVDFGTTPTKPLDKQFSREQGGINP